MEVEEQLSSNKNNFHRNRTLKVLEKWGIEGEMNEFNVRTAASSYARIQIKYRIMKWVTIGAIAFLALFMGLMIGSVVLGIEATKDFKVKNEVIVSRSGNSPLKTSDATFTSSLKSTTPLSFIQGIKSLRFDTLTKDGQKEYIEFEVVSFYYSKGKNLTLYGHNEMANVLIDGTVEVIPVTTVNGAKRYDSSLKRTGTGTGTSTSPNNDTSNQFITGISTCDQFINIGTTGTYYITTDIDCGDSFYPPIQSFGGKLNGNSYTVKINIDANQGEGGVFARLTNGAIVSNTVFEGTVKGSSVCGGIAARSEPNVTFLTNNIFTYVICSASSSSPQVIAGGVVGAIQNQATDYPVSFFRVSSQGRINIISSNLSASFAGDLFGVASGKIYRHAIVAGTFFDNLVTTPSSKNVVSESKLNVKKFGYKSVSYLNLDDIKRNPINKKDININYCEDNQESLDWYYAWLDAYNDIYMGTNTTYESELDQQNTELCLQYYEQYGFEPGCCGDFSVNYDSDCWFYYCHDTLAYGSFVAPCFLCRVVDPRGKRDEPSVYINGTIDGKQFVAYKYNETQRYYYNQVSCLTK